MLSSQAETDSFYNELRTLTNESSRFPLSTPGKSTNFSGGAKFQCLKNKKYKKVKDVVYRKHTPKNKKEYLSSTITNVSMRFPKKTMQVNTSNTSFILQIRTCIAYQG